MKLARLLLAVFVVSILAACSGDAPTAPTIEPNADPSQELICDSVLPDGTVVCRQGMIGSGG